jgi:hypothetical protein
MIDDTLPDDLVDLVCQLLSNYHKQDQSESLRLWNKKMLSTACRHLEYFATPRVSRRAHEIANKNKLGDLRLQRWRNRSSWNGGENLYFEHAKPAADILKELISLGSQPLRTEVTRILCTAEIAWITTEEEKKLPKYKRVSWEDDYEKAGIDLIF